MTENGIISQECQTTDTNNTGPEFHLVRLLTYVPGKTLLTVELTEDLLFSVGKFIASIDRDLQTVSQHEGFRTRDYSVWNLENVLNLEKYLNDINLDQASTDIARDILNDFMKDVVPHYDDFQTGLIHGDCNPGNIILLPEHFHTSVADPRGRVGIIDFGEMVNSFYVFELAVTMSEFLQILHQSGLSSHIGLIRDGFVSVIPLNTTELSCLKTCILARLLQKVILSSWYSLHDEVGDDVKKQSEVSCEFLKQVQNCFAQSAPGN